MYSQKLAEKDIKLAGAYEHVYQLSPSSEVDGLLLPGEITVGHAKEVISYVLHDENRRGTSGLLVCTNFRLMFVTDKPPYCNLIAVDNKLIGPQDVTLSNIETIYIEKQNGKRKKLYPTSRNIKDGIQKLEIHCKDFRILTYSFKLSVLGEGKNIVRAILHHSYPQDSSLSFAMEYISKKASKETSTKEASNISNKVVSLYRKVDDWEKLIMTSQAMKGRWRITSINEAFSLSATMPGLFVVPSSLSDAFLKDAIHQYNNNRLPIWCYTHPNKCSLLRSSNFREESVQFQVDQKIRQEITKCDPSGRKIRMMDLNKMCPSLQQVQMSFHKLKTSCMPANEDEYMESDGKWYSTLQTIKWLQFVSCCLEVARTCVDHIDSGLGTVLLIETLGVDWTACISCLVQVLIDPTKRTIDGLSELIQREWIIGCHPFTTRLGILHQPKKSSKFQPESSTSDHPEVCKSPIFMVFLDCLYQILTQESTKVEYTSFFLTSLADGTRLPVFDTFIFNNERERNRTLQQLNQQRTTDIETISIWDWDVQYPHHVQQLFINPLYRCKRFHHLVATTTPPLGGNSIATNDDVTSPNTLDLTTTPKVEKLKSSKKSSTHHRSASDSTCLDTTTSSMTSSSTPHGHKRINSNSYEVPYQPPQGRSVFYCAGDERSDSGRSVANSRSSSTDNMAAEDDEAVVIGLVDQVNSRAPQVAERLRFVPNSANNNNDVVGCREDDDVMQVKTGVQYLRFWKFAYLRWVSFSQLIGGGESPQVEQENKMADEIVQLASKIEHLEAQLCNGDTSVTSPPPRVDDVTVQFVSSYFPYLAISNKSANKSTLGRVYNFSRKKEGKSTTSASAPSPKIHHHHHHTEGKPPHRPAPLSPAQVAASSHHMVALSEQQQTSEGGTYNRLSSGV